MRWIDGKEINIKQFTGETQQEYNITTFNNNHKLNEEDGIMELNNQLYLHSGVDIWPLLFTYLDEQIENKSHDIDIKRTI